MNEQEHINYNRIARAIEYINEIFKYQPSLDQVAEKVHLSPFYFQRLFTNWAGVSLKKFLQYLTVEYAKKMLQDKKLTLFDAASSAGLSCTSRLHDLFVKIEGMTPGEYKNGGENLLINYSYAGSPFGNIIVASTPKGICYMAFSDNEKETFSSLKKNFPNACFQYTTDPIQQDAIKIFNHDWSELKEIKLHLKGTQFQLKVWETLLRIPMGQLSTYGNIAKKIENPKASRAVGTAIGSNPVAYIIPCHRVIQAGGTVGGYMWGKTRKIAIIGWEASKIYLPEVCPDQQEHN